MLNGTAHAGAETNGSVVTIDPTVTTGERVASVVLSNCPYRVLTVYQPWASLLVTGRKTVETRSTPSTFRGLLFIHAGILWDDRQKRIAYDHRAELGLPAGTGDLTNVLPRGVIIGAVRMVDCQPTEELVEKLPSTEIALGDYGPDRFGWMVQHAVAFKKPIIHRGQQGLKYLPDDVLAAAFAELVIAANDVHFGALTATVD